MEGGVMDCSKSVHLNVQRNTLTSTDVWIEVYAFAESKDLAKYGRIEDLE